MKHICKTTSYSDYQTATASSRGCNNFLLQLLEIAATSFLIFESYVSILRFINYSCATINGIPTVSRIPTSDDCAQLVFVLVADNADFTACFKQQQTLLVR